jgi:hypothetical protein
MVVHLAVPRAARLRYPDRHQWRARVAMHGPEAGDLRQNNADGVVHPCQIEPEQASGRNCRADAAGDTGARPVQGASDRRNRQGLGQPTDDSDT